MWRRCLSSLVIPFVFVCGCEEKMDQQTHSKPQASSKVVASSPAVALKKPQPPIAPKKPLPQRARQGDLWRSPDGTFSVRFPSGFSTPASAIELRFFGGSYMEGKPKTFVSGNSGEKMNVGIRYFSIKPELREQLRIDSGRKHPAGPMASLKANLNAVSQRNRIANTELAGELKLRASLNPKLLSRKEIHLGERQALGENPALEYTYSTSKDYSGNRTTVFHRQLIVVMDDKVIRLGSFATDQTALTKKAVELFFSSLDCTPTGSRKSKDDPARGKGVD